MTKYRWVVTAAVLTVGLFGVGLAQLLSQQAVGGDEPSGERGLPVGDLLPVRGGAVAGAQCDQ